MSIATVGIIPAQLLSIAFGWSHLPDNARFTGFCLGMLGDLIFLISVLCMRNSWRVGIPDKDRTELVTTGIYRFSRNPAFLGFDLQYLGVLLMFGNGLTAGFTVFAAVMLHLQILQEERYLTETFGTPYLDRYSGIWDGAELKIPMRKPYCTRMWIRRILYFYAILPHDRKVQVLGRIVH